LLSKDLKGEVEFRKLANGHWIVQQWWIRAPSYAAEVVPRGYLRVYPLGTHEEGGHVISVDGRNAIPGAAILEGEVVDSFVQQPIQDALVFVSTLPYEAKTDSLGRYRIDGIPAGTYQVAVTTPAKTELRIPLRLHQVTLPPRAQQQLYLISPSQPVVFQTTCANTKRDIGTAIIFGIVRDSASGVPLAGAEVNAEWRGPSLRDPKIEKQTRRTETGDDGRYYLCWMPVDQMIIIKARARRRELGAVDVELNGVTRLRLDFPVRRN
jgi:hypothetical protein